MKEKRVLTTQPSLFHVSFSTLQYKQDEVKVLMVKLTIGGIYSSYFSFPPDIMASYIGSNVPLYFTPM